MPRRPFNRLVDLWTGPGATPANTFVGTFEARLVRETEINPVGDGSPPVHHYLTLADYQPRGAWTAPVLGMDRLLSDRVASVEGGTPDYWVVWTDLVAPADGDPYWRAYLAPLPIWEDFSELEYVYEITSRYVRHYVRRGFVQYKYLISCTWNFVSGGYKVFDSFSYANGTDLDGQVCEGGTEAPQYFFKQGMDWGTVSGVAVANGYTFSSPEPGMLLIESNVSDCRVLADCRQFLFPADCIMGLIFRYAGLGEYWAVWCDSSSSTIYLRQFTGGGYSDVTSGSGAITQSSFVWSRLTVDLAGDDIEVKLDGVTIFTWNDSFNNTSTIHGIMQYRDMSLYDGIAYFDFFGVI